MSLLRARPKAFPFRKPPSPGGAERDRTDDLLLAKQALSQLSYIPCTRFELDREPIIRHAFRVSPSACGLPVRGR